MDPGRGHCGRAAVPMCESFGRDLWRRDHGKSGLVYRETPQNEQASNNWRLMIVDAHAPVYVMRRAASWSRFNSCWATFRWGPRSDTWAASSGLRQALKDKIGLEQ